MMPAMRHPSSLAIGLVLPCVVVASCGSEEAPRPGPRDAAADSPAAVPVDAPASPDRAPQSTPPIPRPDSGPPPPDIRPDYAVSGLPGITAIFPRFLPSPTATTPFVDSTLEVSGTAFAADAVVSFGGQVVATTRVSDEKLTVPLTAALVPQPGLYAVQVENGGGDARARSNILYFALTSPADAGPEIVGYTPDNGIPGDVIRVVGSNIASQPLTITGPGGVTATPGVPESVAWNVGGAAVVNRDAVPIKLPAGWRTGPIVVMTSGGVYRGPIFWAEANLTRLGGVTRAASSEYPSMPFFATSVSDNNLLTSWYTATGNCVLAATCNMGPPTFTFTFPTAQPIARIAMRGLRDQYRGSWDYLRGRFELLDTPDGMPLFVGSFQFPTPERDYDVFFTKAISARIVRFVGEQDQNTGPGLSEIELFPPPGTPLPPFPDAGASVNQDGGEAPNNDGSVGGLTPG
jgi:hypothetical protein